VLLQTPAKGRLSACLALLLAILMICVAVPAAAEAADRDSDGLSDRYERRQSHTLPRRADTDGDGLSDGAEVRRYRTNPRRADTDRDGLDDGDEVDPMRHIDGQFRRYRETLTWSDPRSRDTDRDGLSDRTERRLGTNATVRDTDGDGLDDGYEVHRLGTNPLSGDTDGDGLSDGLEVMMGTNPRDGSSPGPPAPPTDPGTPPSDPGTPSPDPGTPPPDPGTPPPDPGTPPPDPGTPPPTDTDPPQTSITSGPSGTVTAQTASLGFKADETGSTFQCRLDGSSWGACTSPRSYSSLALGAHTFDVRATDGAGNVDPTPASRSWTVEDDTPPPPPPPGDGTCTSVASSVSQAQSAVSSATAGSTVCLANGTYGAVKLSATKSSPGVTLRAQNPGGATIGSVDMSGRFLTLQGFVVDGDVTIAAKSQDMAVLDNDITSGGLAVFLFGDNGLISNVRIAGNRISGLGATVTGENDLIRVHNYRGVTIEHNELRNIYESGGHSDIMQSVHGGAGLVIRRNYVHDQGGTQGFFVKDGALTNLTVEDNLIVDDPKANGYAISFYDTSANANDPFYTGYGAVVRRNTIADDKSGIAVRGSNTTVLLEENVTTNLLKESGTVTGTGNVVGGSPTFVDKAAGDYRLSSGAAGITWDPTAQHYGP
jgi:parallel beta helix pectate lyase-like protein/thrombospondin type 3 repeat protein